MSNRLDLPPVRDLPGPTRRAIRAELVRATRAPARRPRRWLVAAPVAAVAALLAVVLGVTQPWDPAPPVVGVPSASPSVDPRPSDGATPATPSPSPRPAIPAARPIDRGPLDARARSKASWATALRCGSTVPTRAMGMPAM